VPGKLGIQNRIIALTIGSSLVIFGLPCPSLQQLPNQPRQLIHIALYRSAHVTLVNIDIVGRVQVNGIPVLQQQYSQKKTNRQDW